MQKKILVFGIVLMHSLLFSQEDAWLYFIDKENVDQLIDNPIAILTQRAIDRKAKFNITIDYRDVPVNETYIAQIKNIDGITVMAKSKWFNAIHIRGSQDAIQELEALVFIDHVEFANKSLNRSRSSEMVADKFEFENSTIEFTYGTTSNQVEMLNLQKLHQSDFTGEGIVVAVLDAGFPNVNTMGAFQRLRSSGKLPIGYDFVNRTSDIYAYTGNSHGTWVLSTMSGFIQDQFVGTGPDATYYLFRTEDAASENPVEESYWVEAAERADSLGVDILNTSLGYKGYDNPSYSHSNEDLDGETTFITKGANIAFEKGLLLVNSAGNSGINGVNAPADSPSVFSIGAVDENGIYASFSSRGSEIQPSLKPNVSARGRSSFVVGTDNTVIQLNGTSFSSPIITGAMTCLKQALPNRSNLELIQFVQESASQYHSPDFFLGYGIPNFQIALDIGLEFERDLIENFKLYPNPANDYITIQFPAQIDIAELFIIDILGKIIINRQLEWVDNKVWIDNLSNGVYIVKLVENGNSSTFKLIKN